MSLIIGFVQTLLDALGIIYWKKALTFSKVSQQMFAFYSKVFGIFFVILFSFL
jgi:hypothetical protein